jgi:hypothetical protein
MQTRSNRLRKYAIVYEECLKKMGHEKLAVKQRSRRVKPKSPDQVPSRRKGSPVAKKELNTYQIFVREESRKSKYVGIPAQERMTAMAKEWKKSKNN